MSYTRHKRTETDSRLAVTFTYPKLGTTITFTHLPVDVGFIAIYAGVAHEKVYKESGAYQ